MKNALRKLLAELNVRLPDVPFEVCFWDGQTESFGRNPPSFILAFKTRTAAKRILSRGSMGFGEAYVDGDIDVQGDFQQLVRIGIDPRFQDMRLPARTRVSILWQHILSLNTLKRSPGNISRHYDLGNDFYGCYLDRSMTYSCAYFRSGTDTLEEAQEQKYEHICRKLQLKEGETLLDIGCGWGGMLLYAARYYGVRGVGCTLSSRQAEYAEERVEREGLSDTVTILRQDYRNMKGEFDKLVSIGMFEHVGKGFIPKFMERTRSLLKPGGIGLLHTVGKERDSAGDPFTMRYVFPGAYIPVLDHVIRAMGKEELVPVDIENLRLHYASTLDEWRKRFEANAGRIEEMFDARLVRMWRLFLNGSAAAFRWGNIRLYQILFTNGLNNSLPMTREYLYPSQGGQ